jgi:hypothetical protein
MRAAAPHLARHVAIKTEDTIAGRKSFPPNRKITISSDAFVIGITEQKKSGVGFPTAGATTAVDFQASQTCP